MQYSYDESCGSDILTIKDDTYKYLIKARRHKIDDEISFRNLTDDFIYHYKLISIGRKDASLHLVSKEIKRVVPSKELHIAWCIVDPKTVEKHIASLNELGVTKITFVQCDYSQKNFKINIDKLKRILINSSTQCGRSNMIELDTCDCLDNFLQNNKNTYFLDFSTNQLEDKKEDISTLVIGCEGGFSEEERKNFDDQKIVGFSSNLILRSETAIISASAKILI